MLEFVDQYSADNSSESIIYFIYCLFRGSLIVTCQHCLLIFYVDFKEPLGGKNDLHLSCQDVTDFVLESLYISPQLHDFLSVCNQIPLLRWRHR
jgi:hypothetical protein